MLQFLFLVIAALGLLAALGTVLARNLVHAALFLVAFFFTIACQFVLLEAEFLAALQVLVYIGAVAIILMFGIMLTRNILGDDTTSVSPVWMVPALLAGLCVFGILVFGINNAVAPAGHSPWSDSNMRPSIALDAGSIRATAARREAVNNMARTVGLRADEPLRRRVRGGGIVTDGRLGGSDRPGASGGGRARRTPRGGSLTRRAAASPQPGTVGPGLVATGTGTSRPR